MYVEDYMSAPALTIRQDEVLEQVREILHSRNFRHLPVVDESSRLVGMVTDRDLRSAYPSTILSPEEITTGLDRLAKTPVRAIMSTNLVTLTPSSTLDDALFLLDRHKVGALTVVDENFCVLGVFSIRDLIKAYKQLFGLGEKGSALVTVEDDGQPKLLTRLVRVLEEHEIPFTRLVRTTGETAANGQAMAYVRVNTYNLHAVHAALRQAGLVVRLPRPGMVEPGCR